MLAIVYSIQTWRHFVLGTEHKVTLFADHENLLYFSEQVKLNRTHTRCAGQLLAYNFVIIYQKDSSNQKADILSRCLAYTSGVGDTTAVMYKQLLGPDQWLGIGAMDIEIDDYQQTAIAALHIGPSTLAHKARHKQDAMQDEEYQSICKFVYKGEKVDEHNKLTEETSGWRGWLYAPFESRRRIMRSEHNSIVGWYVWRDRMLKVISRNFYWPKMEDNCRKHSKKCDNCYQTKAPSHAKHGLLPVIELCSNTWTHISTDFITDLQVTTCNVMNVVVLDQFTKMVHFIRLWEKDSLPVARAYLDRIFKPHGFP